MPADCLSQAPNAPDPCFPHHNWIRRAMLDLEGVERPAAEHSSSNGTRFAIAVTWEGAGVQLDPSPAAPRWLGLLSRVH